MAAFHFSRPGQERASVASFGLLCSLRNALSSKVICRFLGRPRPLLGLGTTISGTSGLLSNLGEGSGSAVGGTWKRLLLIF